jgi:putative FmdB family regulatory protein
MPKYEFECPFCNLRFERSLKMADHATHECPKCHSDAPRIWNGFAFGFGDTPGAATANTGVHDKDYPTADKAVGRSAESRWSEYHDRAKVKKTVREKGGSPTIMRRNGTGFVEYEAMNTAGVDANVKLRRAIVEARKAGAEQ